MQTALFYVSKLLPFDVAKENIVKDSHIKEENICEMAYLIKNVMIKPNSIEEHSIYIELEVEISCIAYEEKEIQK